MTIDSLLTDNEVAKILKTSRSSVWRLTKTGKLPQPIKIGTNTTRWRLTAIQAAMNAAGTITDDDRARASKRSKQTP